MVLPADAFAFIEVAMPATPGARLGLKELTLGDGTIFRTPSGNLKTLALAQWSAAATPPLAPLR